MGCLVYVEKTVYDAYMMWSLNKYNNISHSQVAAEMEFRRLSTRGSIKHRDTLHNEGRGVPIDRHSNSILLSQKQ